MTPGTDSPTPHAPGPAPQEAGVPDAAPSPWDRAHHFVDYLTRLSVDEWEEVLQRVHAVDATAHAAALRRVAELLDVHPNVHAADVLQRAACAAPPSCARAGRLATHAAFALAFRDALSAREFAALYGPFARPEPSTPAARPPAADDEPHVEDRRVTVDALADVARPLGGV